MNGCFFLHFNKVYGKIWVGFCLNIEKRLFPGGFILKATERPSLKRLEILNICNTLTWKQIFWKTQALLKKLVYFFLVESTKIENAAFP